MADTLRRLINNETCRLLQEKLESWYKDYYVSESLEKDRLLRELSSVRSFEVEQLEKELSATRLQLSLMQQDLTKAHLALEDTKTKSATTLLAAEDEIVQLKTDGEDFCLPAIWQICFRLARSRSSSPRLARSRSPSPLSVQNFSPSRGRLNHALRHARLVERFNNAYSQERLNAQTLLRSYTDDLETVQRIIYTAVVESFYAAKKAFRQFKMRVRKTLSLNYSGPEPLEDMEVIRALNISPKISVPGVDFIMISSLIRELCRIAFSMQTLDPPLDVAFGTDGELFSEYKYRRSYDSDFTAPLVAYHVWPALMEEDSVVVKGEAVTKRGALVGF
ncbi:hypothetical protein Chor_000823 [Crotalus horridus]